MTSLVFILKVPISAKEVNSSGSKAQRIRDVILRVCFERYSTNSFNSSRVVKVNSDSQPTLKNNLNKGEKIWIKILTQKNVLHDVKTAFFVILKKVGTY